MWRVEEERGVEQVLSRTRVLRGGEWRRGRSDLGPVTPVARIHIILLGGYALLASSCSTAPRPLWRSAGADQTKFGGVPRPSSPPARSAQPTTATTAYKAGGLLKSTQRPCPSRRDAGGWGARGGRASSPTLHWCPSGRGGGDVADSASGETPLAACTGGWVRPLTDERALTATRVYHAGGFVIEALWHCSHMHWGRDAADASLLHCPVVSKCGVMCSKRVGCTHTRVVCSTGRS